jgi:DNA (cytosine-5)-methyltransferase 1
MPAYYNEIDPYAAEWLRNLILFGLIAEGDVDTRSIVDVRPDDLRRYDQCHFFAGIGVWSRALRSVGWADDRNVWTGSCPCQPFSVAGRGDGFSDERHLWPHWHYLIQECRPRVVFGEQVASADGLAWLDLVHADLEGTAYAVGAFDLCAAGVGAPHMRQRLYFVADRLGDSDDEGLEGLGCGHRAEGGRLDEVRSASEAGEPDALAPWVRCECCDDFVCTIHGEHVYDCECPPIDEWDSDPYSPTVPGTGPAAFAADSRVADAAGAGRVLGGRGRLGRTGRSGAHAHDNHAAHRPGATNGEWRDADWLFCRDDKWRPVEPGSFPLAHGTADRVGRLRAYGNAIVAPLAAEMIRAYMEVRP